MTARIVSTRPLVFDVLDLDAAMQREAGGFCDLVVIATLDAKLRPVLAQSRFNQVVQLSAFFGGNAEYPNQFVLSDLAPSRLPDGSPGVCRNRSGLVISYHREVEYLNVYNDGSLFFQDAHFNSFGAQKLSHDELSQVMAAFAAARFDSLPSTPPPIGLPDRDSVTLVCARHQRVSLKGQETRLAPLLARLDQLKARATARSFYLLVANARRKLTIVEWPFRQIRLSQIEAWQNNGMAPPAAIHDVVPAGFLSKLPQAKITGTSAPHPDPDIYVHDAGQLYHVIRDACMGDRPRCTAFEGLTVRRVQQPNATLYSPGGLYWPQDVGVDLSQLGADGLRISTEEFQKHQAFYGRLHEHSLAAMGYSFIKDGYVYPGVRVCRIDPQGPASPCLNANAQPK